MGIVFNKIRRFVHKGLVLGYILIGICTSMAAHAQENIYLPTPIKQNPVAQSVYTGKPDDNNQKFKLHIGVLTGLVLTRGNTSAKLYDVTLPQLASFSHTLYLNADFNTYVSPFVEVGIMTKRIGLNFPYNPPGVDTMVVTELVAQYVHIPVGLQVNFFTANQRKFRAYGIVGLEINVLSSATYSQQVLLKYGRTKFVEDVSDKVTPSEIGFMIGGGLTGIVYKNIGLFADFRSVISNSNNNNGWVPTPQRIEFYSTTLQVNGGISVRIP